MATTNNTQKILVNYFNRDFNRLREDIINYARTYHPDKFAYLNDASPDVMYMELLAYIGDNLNFQLDRAFNESFKETAQSRESLIRIAQDLEFNNYFPKPATEQVTVSITVPPTPNANGSAMTPDPNYFITLFPGLKVQSSNGTYFECLEEINFGDATRRKIIPNLDGNNQLIDYTIEKTTVITAGETKVQRFYVSAENVRPFLEILLTDTEITEVIGAVAVQGNTYDIPDDAAFRDLNTAYIEVKNLAESEIFVDLNPLPQEAQSLVNLYTDMTIHYGEWINKPRRFIVRRDQDNNTSLIFGSTLVDFDYWNNVISNFDVRDIANFSLNQILNNMALGEVPPINSTLFIKYRNGAGIKTSSVSNQELTIIEKQFSTAPTTANLSVLELVRNSLTVTALTPAVGGVDAMSNEEIRQSIGKVFAANNRAVTYEDVKALILEMPARFGQPYRIGYEEIKPQLMNYSQVKGYLDQNLAELLTLDTNLEREKKVQEIEMFINNLPNEIANVSSNTNLPTSLGVQSDQNLTNAPSLWIGEKCRLYVLGINEDNQPVTIYKDENGLWKYPNQLLKLNIRNWLREKRIIGDWIDIVDAMVVNFQVRFKILADKKNKQKVLVDCLTKLRDYFDISNWQINQPIFISNVITVLQEIEGVINVIELKFYNVFGKDIETGKEYSPVEIGRYKNNNPIPVNSFNNKFEMNNIDNVIVSYPSTFLSVRYPDIDLQGEAI